MKIADSTTSASPWKCLQESEVIKSDKMVENVKGTSKKQFINPFHRDLEDDQLYSVRVSCGRWCQSLFIKHGGKA